MNLPPLQNGWFPYKIPQAPSDEDVGDYSLFLTPDAVPNTNPSKFLRWRKSSQQVVATTIRHPWKITVEDKRPVGATSPVWKYAIEQESQLFTSFGGTEITVTNADGVFRDFEEGYYFIDVDFDNNGEVTQARIEISETMGNAIEISGSPEKQTKLRQQIGHVILEEETPEIFQTAFHNFSLFDICRNGIPIKVSIAT